jgi:esterase/lipase superfamily enzyme
MNKLLALLFLLCIAMPAAFAQECKALKIPVFFVTDRARVDKGDKGPVEFSGERQYRGMCKHDPYVGVAYCVVRNLENKKGQELCPDLGWQPINKLKEGPAGIDLSTGTDYAARRANFWEQVYAASQKVASPHEVDVFIPGYMSTFESGLRSAARLSYYSERPVILYSWPSKGKFTAYSSDESTIEWSQEHFNDVISDLTTLSKRESPLRVRMYAHSMGARLALRATPNLKQSNAVDEMAMICPDVDAGLVKHYASRYFERRGSTILRLYESSADKMLRLSKLVHGGYARFGEDYEPIDLLIPRAAVAKAIVAADGGATASTDPASPATAGSVTKFPRLPLPPPLYRRMQTIDFSAIDMGTLGHRIPVELICSLSRNNEVSKGLAIEVVQPHAKQLDPNSPKPDPNDGVIKIISTSKWRKIPLYTTMRQYRPRPTLWMTKDWTIK